MRKNHSISLTNPKTCAISAALAHLSRACRSRFGPLLFWLAALLIIVSPVPAESQTNPHRSWSAPARSETPTKAVRRAVRRRQHRHRGRACRQHGAPGRRGSSRAAAVSGPSRAASWSAPARLEAPSKASPSRCPPTATPPSWAGLATTGGTGAAWVYTRSGGVWTQQGSKLVGTGAVGQRRTRRLRRAVRRRQHRHRGRAWRQLGAPGRRGSTPAAAASGPSRAASWSAPARLETPNKATPSRCPPTATPPSWAGLTTTRAPGRRGSTPAAAASGPSKAASWSAPARLEAPAKASPSRCPPTATPPSWAGLATTRHRSGVGLHPQRRRLDPAGQQAGRHRRGWNRQPRLLRRAVRRRQHRHRGRG